MTGTDRREEILMAEDSILELAVELEQIQFLRNLSETSTIRLAEAQQAAKLAGESLSQALKQIEATRSRIKDLDEFIRKKISNLESDVAKLDDDFVKDMNILSSRVSDLTDRLQSQIATLGQEIDGHLQVRIEQAAEGVTARLNALEENHTVRISDLSARVDQSEQILSAAIAAVSSQLIAMQASDAETRKLVTYELILGGVILLGVVITIVLAFT